MFELPNVACAVFEQDADEETVSLDDVEEDFPRQLLPAAFDVFPVDEDNRRRRC